jgi:hypothetical protein
MLRSALVVAVVLAVLACGTSAAPPGTSAPEATTRPPPAGSPTATPPAREDIVCTMDVKRCPDGTEVGRTGPRCEFVCPDGGAKACTTSDDCSNGETCTGKLGCDEGWHCAKPACTRDLVTFCGCDGKTFKASGTCPGRKASKRGPC